MRLMPLALAALPLLTLNCSCASMLPYHEVDGEQMERSWPVEGGRGFRPWEARSLGSAQDAGMPHLGCAKKNCADARLTI